jgi:uncharacterized protein YcfJ
MRASHSSLLCALFAAGVLCAAPDAAAPQGLQRRPAEQNPRVVACRVIEVHTSREPAVSVVVFHQRDKVDADRLSGLLRRAVEGGTVEFQLAEGPTWQQATVARLKSCFGRGLLIVTSGPPGAGPLSQGDTFLLRFPVATVATVPSSR